MIQAETKVLCGYSGSIEKAIAQVSMVKQARAGIVTHTPESLIFQESIDKLGYSGAVLVFAKSSKEIIRRFEERMPGVGIYSLTWYAPEHGNPNF